MQEDPKPQLSTFFYDPLLLNYITEYLTIRERMQLSILNKKLRFIMQEHFTNVLKDNKLHLIHGKTPIHQLRFYFNRCLRIFKLQKDNQSKEQVKESWDKKDRDSKSKKNIQEKTKPRQNAIRTIENPFKFKVISGFSVGPIFTCCLDNNEKAFVMKTNHLIYLTQNIDKQPVYLEQSNIRSFSCKSEKLLFVNTEGQVSIWQSEKQSMGLEPIKSIMKWTQYIPVKKVTASFTYAILQLENPFIDQTTLQNAIFDNEYKVLKKQQQPQIRQFMYFVALNVLGNYFHTIKVPGSKVISVAAGHKDVYFVNQLNQCYVVEFQTILQLHKQVLARPYQHLMGKKISKVSSGYNFFFALERHVEFLEEWTNERVLEWLRQIGFGNFVRIFRVQKVDGKQLKDMSKKYLENVLGMTKLNMQQKLMLCIQQVLEGKNQTEQLWVWGKNQFGQLGVSNANYLARPQRLKMDFIPSNERIDNIFCGWYQTFVRTHKGKIYCTIRTSQRKKKKIIQEKQTVDPTFSDEQDFRRAEDNNKYKNKKRKFTQDIKQSKEDKRSKGQKRFEEQQHWQELQAGKAFFVSAFKDFTFIIQCPDQSKFEPVKQKKLRTAKAVIDKIMWAGSKDKTEYMIGIVDKEMGTIEVSPMQIQTFDYKQSAIRYIKHKGAVVWDRQTKVDNV